MNVTKVKAVKIVSFVLLIVGLGILGKGYWQKIINPSTRSTSLVGKPDTSNREGAIPMATEIKLPEDFPKDFPIYEGAKLTSSSSVKGEAGKGLSVVWEMEGNLTSISKFYENELSKGGWILSSRLDGDNFLTFSLEKGDIKGFVGITKKQEDKVAVSVSLGVK